MGGQVILRLRHKVFQFIIRMLRPHQSFGGIALVATRSFCRDRNFCCNITLGRDHCPFLHSILTESRHQLLLRLQFLSRHKFCRDLVCNCLKLMNKQLFILYQFSNSQHQLNQFHTAIQTYILFNFHKICIGKRMLPFFK